MNRQPRGQRRAGQEVVLTPRDQELLRALARLRVARTGALVRLCLGSVRRDTAARRLRRLFDAGFLAVRATEATQENLYMLGPKGREFVRGEGEAEPRVPRGGLDHHLSIVETWVSLATLELPDVGLQLARADWELRTEFGGALPIVPDLFAVLNAPAGPVPLAVEVDLGTEPLKVLRAKLATYAWLTLSRQGLFGWAEFGVCIALRRKGRIPFMRELLAENWSERSFLWCLEDGPKEELSRLAAIGMAPLTDSPCTKGRVASTSQALPMRSGDQEQGL